MKTFLMAEDLVFYVNRQNLQVDPKAEWRDQRGKLRAVTERDLDRWLGTMARVRPDGTVRVLASRYIKGKPIGEYRYHNPQWQLPVVLTIRDRGGRYDVVGPQRPRQDPKIKVKTPKQKPRYRESLTKSNEVMTSLTQ
jgi:hypothetical protein